MSGGQLFMNLHEEIIKDLTTFLTEENSKFSRNNRLKIDLHCHDKNSSEPDELMGRLLGVPETWLPTSKLIKTLKSNNCNAFTITNHNNARSCYKLQDKGMDILTGAEFSVKVPDFGAGIHVLAYGFSPSQEKILNSKRDNVYKFQNYALENDIPTIWAHPLFHYHSSSVPTMDLFNKLSLVFERFEALNGQRDTWQNMLVKNWVNTLTPEKLDEYSRKYKINQSDFCRNKYNKVLAGGSDEHMGIFSGLTGTYLYAENSDEIIKQGKASEAVLEALLNNKVAVYGSHHDSERMAIAFLDYFCQIGLNIEDPGLIRLLLHKGDPKEKFYAMLIANSFFELKRHKITYSFLKTVHRSFSGKKPSIKKNLVIPKKYKPIFKEIKNIANSCSNARIEKSSLLKESIESIYRELLIITADKLEKKIKKFYKSFNTQDIDFNNLFQNFELPADIRSLLSGKNHTKSNRVKNVDLSDFTDGLSFPALGSAVILSSVFTSARVLYNTRPLLEKFSTELNIFKHPKRMLWLTDTFEDTNGVALVLKSILKEIQKRNLPIDICVCSNNLKSEDHLVVLPPVKEFTVPFYQNQKVRIPDYLKIHNLFKQNEYDRVICSTEGFMGAAAVILKKAYSVPAYFYIHTDWMTFSDKVLNFNKHNKNRLKRFLRSFYNQFDHLFVLNSDQLNWFKSSAMNFNNRVSQTAHWTEPIFTPVSVSKTDVFNISNDSLVLLFAGRLSKEKGVDEIPKIFKKISKDRPEIKMVFVGTGPEEEKLKEKMPDAVFCGWVDHSKLPSYYSAADLLILPSKFDTFGCVVLEAMSCGLPVAAYRTKGPKDIIEDNKSGFLAGSKKELISKINAYFSDNKIRQNFKHNAQKRSLKYNAEDIILDLLEQMNLEL